MFDEQELKHRMQPGCGWKAGNAEPKQQNNNILLV